MYCFKCKTKTETSNITKVTSKNNRQMMKGICSKCDTRKSMFVTSSSSPQGKGFTDKFPIEFHLFSERGENVPSGSFNDQQKYSYCGPGTKYTQRNNEGYVGINDLDKKCKMHDEFYSKYPDTKSRIVSDIALAHKAKEIASNPRYDDTQRRDADLVSKLLNTKATIGLGISKKWNEELAYELHRPKRNNYERSKVIVNRKDDVWGADLVEMQKYSKVNDNYRYLLTVIDCFTKYAWAIPLKNKEAKSVVDAFKLIVKTSGRIPKHIWVDEGKEFYNSVMTQWINKNDIIRYSTHGAHKSAIVERFNRTLKTKMWREFTANENTVWIDGLLDRLMNEYNHIDIHRTIGMTPAKASLETNSSIIRKKLRVEKGGHGKYRVGDKVRISLVKGIFAKGYEANWSEQVYVIDSIKNTMPVSYTLKDLHGEPLIGRFYEPELQKTNQEVFRIEKVISKKTNKDGTKMIRVKWRGYPDKFNQWIPEEEFSTNSDLLQIVHNDEKIDKYFQYNKDGV